MYASNEIVTKERRDVQPGLLEHDAERKHFDAIMMFQREQKNHRRWTDHYLPLNWMRGEWKG
jgi:hypothetical protein